MGCLSESSQASKSQGANASHTNGGTGCKRPLLSDIKDSLIRRSIDIRRLCRRIVQTKCGDGRDASLGLSAIQVDQSDAEGVQPAGCAGESSPGERCSTKEGQWDLYSKNLVPRHVP